MEGREGGTEEGKESTEVEEELLEPRGTPHRPHGVIQGVLRYIHLYTRGMQHVLASEVSSLLIRLFHAYLESRRTLRYVQCPSHIENPAF